VTVNQQYVYLFPSYIIVRLVAYSTPYGARERLTTKTSNRKNKKRNDFELLPSIGQNGAGYVTNSQSMSKSILLATHIHTPTKTCHLVLYTVL
jgi:hypothetical protein